MPDFEHGNPLALELSEDTLAHLRDELAKILILRGKIEEALGVYPVSDQDSEPRMFTYPLEPEFLKKLLFANDDDTIVKEGYVQYYTPHRLEASDMPEDAVDHFIFMAVKSQLISPSLPIDQQLEVDTTFRIGQLLSDGPVEGTKDVQYLQNDIAISPSGLPRKKREASRDMTFEELEKYVIDYTSLEQPLTFDDGEMLAKVVDYIQTHPRID